MIKRTDEERDAMGSRLRALVENQYNLKSLTGDLVRIMVQT